MRKYGARPTVPRKRNREKADWLMSGIPEDRGQDGSASMNRIREPSATRYWFSEMWERARRGAGALESEAHHGGHSRQVVKNAHRGAPSFHGRETESVRESSGRSFSAARWETPSAGVPRAGGPGR